MAKPLAAILKSYSDVIAGKLPASEVNKLTLGKEPGVDYDPKMPDEREFVASHSVEKHPDRVGNGPEVYNGANVKQAVDDRHGHIPNPKSKNQYTQANEAVEELDETSGAKAERYKKAARSKLLHLAVHTKDGPDKNRKIVNRATGMERADRAIDKDIAKRSAAQKKRLGEAKDEREYGYESDMAITQLKTICRNAEHLMKMMKPDTDLPEWVQSKITKAEDYISTAHDYLMPEMNEDYDPKAADDAKGHEYGEKMSKKAVKDDIINAKWHKRNADAFAAAKKKAKRKAVTGMDEEVELTEAKCNMTEAGKMCEVHGMKACPKEGDESASDKEPRYLGKKKEGRQLITDKKTISEVLTKKTSVGKVISDFEKSDDPRFKGDSKDKRKERALAAWYKMHPEKSKKKMKEESSPADTTITFPSGNSREGFKL